MALLLDIIIIFVFGVSVITCAKRGFIRSIMGIVTVIVAIIGSIMFYPKLSTVINDNYMNDFLTEKVSGSINSLTENVDSMDISDLFKEKPQAFIDVLNRFNIDFDTVNDYYENNVDKYGDNAASTKISSFIADRLSNKISDIVAFAALFIGISIVMTLIMLLINLIFKTPILNKLNKSLGLILGIITGLLYSWGFSIIMYNIVPQLSAILDGKIPENVIDSTIIVKFLGNINIFGFLH